MRAEDRARIYISFVKDIAIAKSRYFVVRRQGGWTFMHNGRDSITFLTYKEAVDSALAQSRADESPQVLVQGDDMAFREKWNSENEP